MKEWKRGDIFYVLRRADSETGRPAVIVSNEKVHNCKLIQVVFLSGSPKEDLTTHIDISTMQKTSVALCEQIQTVPIDSLGDYIGHCSDYELQMIDIALSISLDLVFSSRKGIEHEMKKSETKPAESVMKQPESVMKQPESVIKLTAERDTYKQLYEKLLERMMQ